MLINKKWRDKMEEELREQPTMELATALNRANDDGAESEVGSQKDLGKFKSASALLEAYNNLQAEFTRKCQLLSELQKEKTEQEIKEDNMTNDNQILPSSQEMTQMQGDNLEKTTLRSSDSEENQDKTQEFLAEFLSSHKEAENFIDEIKAKVSQNNQNPFENAWESVILSHFKSQDLSDMILNQYVLSDERIKNKIIQDYLLQLNEGKPPKTLSSNSGQRLSSVIPDNPLTLEDAKKLVGKMFS